MCERPRHYDESDGESHPPLMALVEVGIGENEAGSHVDPSYRTVTMSFGHDIGSACHMRVPSFEMKGYPSA